MKRISFLLAIALLLAPSAVHARPSNGVSIAGRLVAVHFEAAGISVQVGARVLTVRVTPNTSIERHGEYATLASLKIGDRIEVLAARSGNVLVAQSIRAE